MLKKILVTVCLFFVVTAVANSAVEIDKTRLELTADAGEKYVSKIKLTNKNTTDVTIEIAPSFYRHLYTKGTIKPEGNTELPSCQAWIFFEKNNYLIKAGESIEVPLTLDIPSGKNGEYVASILLDQKENNETLNTEPDNIKINLVNRLAIPVYLIIKDTCKISAEITEFTYLNPKDFDISTLNTNAFVITIKNTGTAHIRAKGIITIFDGNGNVIKNIPVGETFPIFGGFSEKIPVFTEFLQPGKYKAIATIAISATETLQAKTEFEVK